MIKLKQFIPIFLLVLSLSMNSSGITRDEQIPILVIVDTQVELSVDYRTGAKLARNLILLGSLLDSYLDASSASRHSKKLREIVGELDRSPIIENGFAGGFTTQPYFKATLTGSGDAYGTAKKPNFSKIKKAGFTHVLTVKEERAGLISAWEMSTLSAFSTLAYKLFDTESGKDLVKDKVNGFAGPKYSYDEATTQSNLFLQDYPHALGAAIGRIIGDLRKNGFLSLIAQQHGLGDKVPDTAKILSDYERRFSYKFKEPKGWYTTDMNTEYVTVLSPTKDAAFYGLNITFDLLLDVFDQRVNSVEEYALIFLNRAKAGGFQVVEDTFSEFELGDGFTRYTIKQKDSGIINVLLFKKLDENFIVIYSVIITQNFDTLFAKHKAGIESIINTAKIRTK